MAKPKIRQRTKRVASCQQKGGVGKTMWALAVASAAARAGARVLFREMDPQANGSDALEPAAGEYTMNDALRVDERTGEVVEGALGSAIRATGKQWPATLYVVPAERALDNRERDSAIGVPRERRLQVVSAGALDPFDLVVTDCPPSVGLLTVNALVDSDEAHIISMPTKWSLTGAYEARRTIDTVRRFHNPDLEFSGAWMNMYNRSHKEDYQRWLEFRAFEGFEGKVQRPLPRATVVSKAAGANSPLWAYGAEAAALVKYFDKVADRMIHS